MKRWWRKWVTAQFHKIFYRFDDQAVWRKTSWLGFPALKCPLDLWVYQEILYGLKPDLIVETGTFQGGSALYLASICELLNHGRVLTIDSKTYENQPEHDRISYVRGSSVDDSTFESVQQSIQPGEIVIVILDSEHHQEHVLKELQLYSQLVTVGSYLIVEDTNINGHPVWPGFGPGPMEAVEAFLETNTHFVIDRSQEKFYLTFNPGGYLKRVA